RPRRGVLRDLRLRLRAQLHQLLQPRAREEIPRAIADDRRREAPRAGVADRQGAAGRRRPPGARPRLGRDLLVPAGEGHPHGDQRDLQSLADGGRLAGSVRSSRHGRVLLLSWRLGDYRVVFEETGTELIVTKIGPRGSVYD